MAPPSQNELYQAARERAKLGNKPMRRKKKSVSDFARAPQPRTPGTGRKRQQSY